MLEMYSSSRECSWEEEKALDCDYLLRGMFKFKNCGLEKDFWGFGCYFSLDFSVLKFYCFEEDIVKLWIGLL